MSLSEFLLQLLESYKDQPLEDDPFFPGLAMYDRKENKSVGSAISQPEKEIPKSLSETLDQILESYEGQPLEDDPFFPGLAMYDLKEN